jgi:hypothetical protein
VEKLDRTKLPVGEVDKWQASYGQHSWGSVDVAHEKSRRKGRAPAFETQDRASMERSTTPSHCDGLIEDYSLANRQTTRSRQTVFAITASVWETRGLIVAKLHRNITAS